VENLKSVRYIILAFTIPCDEQAIWCWHFMCLWVPLYYSTYAKREVTQLFPNLINFNSLIMSNDKKVKDTVQ